MKSDTRYALNKHDRTDIQKKEKIIWADMESLHETKWLKLKKKKN